MQPPTPEWKGSYPIPTQSGSLIILSMSVNYSILNIILAPYWQISPKPATPAEKVA
jgi:hypothetical protein